ncbi:MAG: hypothetical protein WCW29_05235 [Candidatus Paceibacterota bacterium]
MTKQKIDTPEKPWGNKKAYLNLPKKYYTVSTHVFTSFAEAEKKLQEWNDAGTLKEDTRIFRINGDVSYRPRIKLVREVNKI